MIEEFMEYGGTELLVYQYIGVMQDTSDASDLRVGSEFIAISL